MNRTRRAQWTMRAGAVLLFTSSARVLAASTPTPPESVPVTVDFRALRQRWDGFGFNYVETAQTPDPRAKPQDYGGFSRLEAEERRRIVNLVFGDDGLRVGVLKMFLDPFHQPAPGAPFDHETTTSSMRWFAKEGLRVARAAGRDLTVITTLYGPPAWMTRQRVFRGRDLDPDREEDLIRYIVEWARFLREREGLPLRWVSLHNEGEDWQRWSRSGRTEWAGHDYNLFWPPDQVVRFLPRLAAALRAAGLGEVGVTPGETTNWFRFDAWGYADAIAANRAALDALGLITSHGFFSGQFGRWFGDFRSGGIERLRRSRPEVRAWTTSMSWDPMTSVWFAQLAGNIYGAGVSAIIPWAGIQRPQQWIGGDPNPGCAIQVHEDGRWEIRPGYWLYRQISRIGQPGMAVAAAHSMCSELAIIAFASNGTQNPAAFVIANFGPTRWLHIRVRGGSFERLAVDLLTTPSLGPPSTREVSLDENAFLYEAPAGSVTTFRVLTAQTPATL